MLSSSMATAAQQPQPQTPPAKTSQKGDRLKVMLGVVVLLGCAFLTCGFVVGYSIRSGLEAEPTLTPTPVEDTPTPSPTPTEEGETPTPTPDEDLYEGWSTFVLPECNIRLQVPPEWYPGKRGDLGACGSFRTIENTGFDSFNNYEGTLLIFSRFLDQRESDSVLAFPDDEYRGYLNRIETDPAERDEVEDLLIGDVRERLLIDKNSTRAEIDRAVIGTAEHIFYELFGRQYVILYGGETVPDNIDEIEHILNSIEFQEPIQNED